VAGTVALGLGVLWSFQFPIIKLLWTSSYVLVSCGIAAILLAIFHLVIEVWQLRLWTMPFVWIGMNAITIYMASAIANFRGLATRIIGGEVARSLGSWADFAHAAVALGMVLWFANFLYRRKIFLRL
jgi:predicted acyltransferase